MRNSTYRVYDLLSEEDSNRLTRKLLSHKGILNVKTSVFASKVVVCYDDIFINHIDIRNIISDAGFDI